MAALVANELNLPMVYVRPKVKEYVFWKKIGSNFYL